MQEVVKVVYKGEFRYFTKDCYCYALGRDNIHKTKHVKEITRFKVLNCQDLETELEDDNINDLKLVEYIEYVSFKTAIEHMKNGGVAKYQSPIMGWFQYKMEYRVNEYALVSNDDGCINDFFDAMLEVKWVLL